MVKAKEEEGEVISITANSSYYHKMNHTVDECYSKHGYPSWYNKIDNQNSQEKGKLNGWSQANACKEEPNIATETQTRKQNNPDKPLNPFTPEKNAKTSENAGKQ